MINEIQVRFGNGYHIAIDDEKITEIEIKLLQNLEEQQMQLLEKQQSLEVMQSKVMRLLLGIVKCIREHAQQITAYKKVISDNTEAISPTTISYNVIHGAKCKKWSRS